MNLSKFIKISEITNLSDARYCAGMGVNQLGFILDEHNKKGISNALFQEISKWISGVDFVGEMNGLSIEEIKNTTQNVHLQYLEISDLANVVKMKEWGIPFFFKLVISTKERLNDMQQNINFLSDYVEQITLVSAPEFYEAVDKNILELNKPQVRIIRGFDVTQNNIDSLPSVYDGFQLYGTEEDKTGFKDYGEIMDILEILATEN